MGEVAERRVVAERYEIVGLLGRDRMGTLYRGRDLELGRLVAIKLLEARLSTDAQALARFRREERSGGRLSHANVVTIYDSGVDHGDHYIVMELVAGGTLEELLQERGPLPVPTALALEDDILRALASAHEAGLLHGSVSPGSVMLTRRGVPKLAGFGIAGVVGSDSRQTGSDADAAACLAPELATGGPLTAAADVYGAGCLLYAMLAGPPSGTGVTPDIETQHVDDALEPLSALRADVPPVVDALVAKALKKRPEDRFESAREMLRVLQDAPVLLPPPGTRDAWQRPPEDEGPHEWSKASVSRGASSRPRSEDRAVLPVAAARAVLPVAAAAAGVAGSGAGQAGRGQIYPRYIRPDHHISRPLVGMITAIVIAFAVIVPLAAPGMFSSSPSAGTPLAPAAAPSASMPPETRSELNAADVAVPRTTAAGQVRGAIAPAGAATARATAKSGTPAASSPATTTPSTTPPSTTPPPTPPPPTTAPPTTAPATPPPTAAPSSSPPAVVVEPGKEPKATKPGKSKGKGQTALPSPTPTPVAP